MLPVFSLNAQNQQTVEAKNAVEFIWNLSQDSTIIITGELKTEMLNRIKIAIRSKRDTVSVALDLSRTTGLTEIGSFWKCVNLTSIIIPNSVTKIDKYTFSDCTNLMSIVIPNSVQEIGEGTFYGCTSLTSITIPNSVIEIGNLAFYGCSKLSTEFKTDLKERFNYTSF